MASVRLAVPDDAPAIARVHVDSWRSTYAGIVPQTFLDGLTYEGREEMWRRNLTNPERKSVLLVAEDEAGKIVGFAVGGPGRDEHPDYDAELYAIYLFQETQGQGIGRQLMSALAGYLVEQGYKAWLIWVLRDNPSRGFYERTGGQYVTEKTIEIGGAALPEIAYGWRDLREIVEPPRRQA